MTLEPGQFTAMISSTALDLPQHREAVKEACIGAGVFPIGMEYQPARDDSGITVSLEMVDKADIYLGIYAWRYGWVPEGKDISITEMEFDQAVKRKAEANLREILIFTAHNNHPFTRNDVEVEQGAQEKLAAFKTKAVSGRGRKEFNSVEELRRLVSEALHEFLLRAQATNATRSETQPPSTSIKNNLPRLQPFFGREAELANIRAALDPASRTWGTLIDGDGGKGKTALAIRAAYDCPPVHFDRIVFVSMKQQEQDDHRLRKLEGFALSSWMQMLNEIARVLDLPEVAKASEPERARILRDKLDGRRVLLVLDNLETLSNSEQDQLFTFLDYLPGDCKALLTSRTFAGNKLLAIELPELDQTSALQMLAEIAERNVAFAKSSEADRIRLYDQTKGNALLLRWVAGQVGSGHCTNLSDALAHLAACPPGNNPLAYIFSDVVDSLGDQELRLLAALSWPNQPIPVEAIAEIGAVPLADARRWLKVLTNRSLVVPDQDEKQYALVPMVADFLRKHRPEVVRETGDRLEERAYALIVENGYDEHDRFPILDAAWPSVAAALPLFLAVLNPRLQTVCDALDAFLNFTGRWDESLALNQQAEVSAAAANAFKSAGYRAYTVGWIHFLRGQPDAVLTSADRAAAHWQAAQADPRNLAIALQLRGLGYRLKKDYRAAITAYREALDLLRSLSPESVDVAIVLNSLASAEELSRDFPAAERDYYEALRVAVAVGNAEAVATYTANLALLALAREDWLAAETLAREALPLAEKVGRQELIAAACHSVAEALLHQGKASEALPYATRAIKIFSRLGSPRLAGAQATLARCEEAMQR
jgi:tetratricopeptide (TPR) repeat protein